MGLCISHGIGIPFQKSSQSWSSYWINRHPELKTYTTGRTTPLSSTQIIRLGELIETLKTGLAITNLSDAFDALYSLSSETAETQVRNIVKDDHHCTRSNANGRFIKFMGYSAGAVNYLLADFWLDTDGVCFTRNNNSIGVYNRNNGAGAWCDIGAKKDTTYSFLCIIPNYGNGFAYYNNNAAANLDYATPTKTDGLLVNGRSASNRTDYFIDGVLKDYSTDASEALIHKQVYIGAIGPTTITNLKSANTQHFAFIGRYFTASEQLIIKNAFDTYIDSIASERSVELVLEKGKTYDGWKADAIAAPAVCWDGTRYVMTVSFWSIANDGWASGFFTSDDLKTWVYIEGSLIQPSPVSSILGNSGIAWYQNKYWFTFQNQGDPCGLWWSDDLLNWNVINNSIVAVGFDPSINVNYAGNGLELWYVNKTTRDIYLLTSSDGINWSAASNIKSKPTGVFDFGAPTIFYIDGVRYMIVDTSLKSGWRRLYLWHSVNRDATWVYDGPILFNHGDGWEKEQVSDCACIVANLNDGLGSIPRVLYVGSDNNSAIDDTNSSIGLYNLIMESF